MLDIKTLKIGDNVIVIDNSGNDYFIKLNNKYTISYICQSNHEYDSSYVKLFETKDVKYYLFRFKLDLKQTRKQKLDKIKNYESI